MDRRDVISAAGIWLSAFVVGRSQKVRAQADGSDEPLSIARQVVSAYVAAREARDAAAIGALFTADVDQLVSSGEWRRGREGVVEGALASSARNSGQRTIDVEHARRVASDVIVADGRYEIGGAASGEPRRMWSSFVLVRDAGRSWKIAAIRNMLPAGSMG